MMVVWKESRLVIVVTEIADVEFVWYKSAIPARRELSNARNILINSFCNTDSFSCCGFFLLNLLLRTFRKIRRCTCIYV
jgi:hypothetical protein